MLQRVLVVRFRILFCQDTLRMLQLPFMWKQHQNLLAGCLFVIGHFGYDIIQITLRVDVMRFACAQQRTDDRHIDRRFVITAEEVILPSQSDWSYNIFSKIVIPKQTSVLQAFHHVAPSGIDIRDGFPDLRARTVLDTFRFHPYFHCIHDRSGQFLTFCLTLVI